MADSQFNPIRGGVQKSVKTPNESWGTIDPPRPPSVGPKKLRFFFRDGKTPQDQGWKGAKTHLSKKNKKIEDMGI